MSKPRIISIVPYKILPAKLGGEKGIAVFNEYVGVETDITAVSTKNNDISAAKNYQMLPWLPNSRLRYINIFLYFRIRQLIKEKQATHLLIEHPYYGWLAWMIRKTTRVTWVVHSHNIEFERSRSIGRWWWKALKWYEQWVYKSSDINFFISEDDRQYALTQLDIPAAKSHAITYGVEIAGRPADRIQCREQVQRKHGIAANKKLLLFNGALYHHTNYDALQVILDHVLPALERQQPPYTLIVCGKGLPDSFQELKAYQHRNVIYAGFVDDISVYFKAADIFLNPILSGGGVKTKAIEALAYNCQVISTALGALGIVEEVCGTQLQVVPDQDWVAFNSALLQALETRSETPDVFYQYYYWGAIAKKVAGILNENPRR